MTESLYFNNYNINRPWWEETCDDVNIQHSQQVSTQVGNGNISIQGSRQTRIRQRARQRSIGNVQYTVQDNYQDGGDVFIQRSEQRNITIPRNRNRRR